ncbi:tyrosine-type recombinase/integrase [Halovenus sp. WSH3]|uniref:Tyrosine-type recombinase/integrase n=1 Tax=Halovenus carboxidivorans TaxID=2692199 RepID=A0A6B0SWX2_9EURY|nr:site-specific integrase [Halovenus carboxidivorans]MXR50198.1 tyrosine-type recombinase/integrase [Halovenus carboxidivorans]
MRMEAYDTEEGYRVVLNKWERRLVAREIDHQETKTAWQLASYCGLRQGEVGDAEYRDVNLRKSTDDWFLRVWEGKGDEYRETPLPDTVETRINTLYETTESDPEDDIIGCTMRTVRRRFRDVCDRLREEEDERGYQHLTLHDGRRTWANALLDDGVSPLQVMEWGSWDDWRTFRDHYLQDFSEQHQSEELEKVSWV